MRTMVWGCGLVIGFAKTPALPILRRLRLEYADLKRGFVAWAEETDRRAYYRTRPIGSLLPGD